MNEKRTSITYDKKKCTRTEDKVIPYAMGEKLYNNANQPKYFLKIKGQHLEATTTNLDDVVNAIDKLLEGKK